MPTVKNRKHKKEIKDMKQYLFMHRSAGSDIVSEILDSDALEDKINRFDKEYGPFESRLKDGLFDEDDFAVIICMDDIRGKLTVPKNVPCKATKLSVS
jgi:hypothetical protein